MAFGDLSQRTLSTSKVDYYGIWRPFTMHIKHLKGRLLCGERSPENKL